MVSGGEDEDKVVRGETVQGDVHAAEKWFVYYVFPRSACDDVSRELSGLSSSLNLIGSKKEKNRYFVL